MTPVTNPHTMALVGAMFLCGTGGLMFYNYLGAVFETKLGGTPGQVTAALLLVGVVGVAAVFFGGALTDKTNPRAARAVIVGGHAIALLALGVLLTVTTTVTPALFIVIGIWSIFAWALSPAIQAGIMAIDPQRAMLALALGISGLYGGSALGAALGGYLIDNCSSSAIPFAARRSWRSDGYSPCPRSATQALPPTLIWPCTAEFASCAGRHWRRGPQRQSVVACPA